MASRPLIKPRYEPTPLKKEQQTIEERPMMTEDQSLTLSMNKLLQGIPCQRCRSYHQGYILWQLAGYQDLRQLQLWLPDFLSELEEHLEWILGETNREQSPFRIKCKLNTSKLE